jgi:large subunit ribosomal protein L4
MPRTKKITEQVAEKTVKTKDPAKKSGLSISVYDIKGAEIKNLELPKELFSVAANNELLAQYVRVYLSNKHQGTASTKTRGDVAGSTRKIYRQKGTGRARHGSIKAPIFVGGGVVGGPKPRDYSLRLNKKQKRKALFMALTLKQKEHNIIAIDNALTIEAKTKLVAGFLSTLGLANKRTLFIFPKIGKNNFILASRNIPLASLVDVFTLNPYNLLQAHKVIFVDNALSVLEKHVSKNEN